MDKSFNLGHNLEFIIDRTLIIHMCIPCDVTFHAVPHFYLVTLTLKFDLL